MLVTVFSNLSNWLFVIVLIPFKLQGLILQILYSIFSSDELSWRRATELLVEVARQGEETGFGVPCLLVAAKYDLDPFPMAAQDSAKVNTLSSASSSLCSHICI